jgi:hypothetical protein
MINSGKFKTFNKTSKEYVKSDFVEDFPRGHQVVFNLMIKECRYNSDVGDVRFSIRKGKPRK